jgi:DNA-binding transcriptional MocR family regulator
VIAVTTSDGLHVWVPLQPPWNEEAFVTHCRHHGVAIAAGSAFAVGEPSQRGVRVCLGGASPDALRRGLSVLARLARGRPEPALLAV